MKKLIMFVMVFVIAAPVSADLVVRYDFDSDASDRTGNYDGTFGIGVTIGGGVATFDGTTDAWVEIPFGAANPCGGTQDFTIAMAYSCTNTWQQHEEGNSVLFNIGLGDEANQFTIFTFNDGQFTDIWGIGLDATVQSGIGYADGDIHWFIFTYTASTETRAWYGIDGGGSVVAIDSSNPTWGYDVDYSTYTTTIGNGPDAYMDDMGVIPLEGEVDAFALYDHILTEEEMAGLPTAGVGPKNPIKVDPNQMDVYETGETIGDFDVRLGFRPVGQGPGNQGNPYTVEVTIDPNGGNGGWGNSPAGEKDVQLLAGTDPCTTDNQITLTFTPTTSYGDDVNCPEYTFGTGTGTSCWDLPVTILFKALDDLIAEKHPEPPSTLIELVGIGVTVTSTVAEPNLNVDLHGNPWTKNQTAQVNDNDQANILFSYTAWGTSTPKIPIQPGSETTVKIWEEPGGPYHVTRWRKIGVKLQIAPLIDKDPCQPTSVKLQAEIGGDPIVAGNWPPTDPCLPFPESPEPNGIIFTAANYDTYQLIKIWGNDDEELQASGPEGGPPEAEGDQNYEATLSVWVVDDGGDERYAGFTEDDPKTVNILIEDNECGAFGYLAVDVGNPNAFTDPNYRDDEGNPLPDCYVNIYDLIETVNQWFKCSDPQTAGCAQYNL